MNIATVCRKKPTFDIRTILSIQSEEVLNHSIWARVFSEVENQK